MGVAITVVMPFAVLGVLEVAGAVATDLALVGLSAEALAGAGAGALLGIGMVGTTAAIVSGDSKQTSKHMSVNECTSEDLAPVAQRPISAWRTWVSCASPSL
jgi:hypothetical protein